MSNQSNIPYILIVCLVALVAAVAVLVVPGEEQDYSVVEHNTVGQAFKYRIVQNPIAQRVRTVEQEKEPVDDTPPNGLECKDSDRGRNEFVQGVTKLLKWRNGVPHTIQTKQDFCHRSELTEYVCASLNGQPAIDAVTIPCAYGCVNGACNRRGPVCGNGLVETGEQCDDGNRVSGDGCDASCNRETCTDGILNNRETDIDCGGPFCAPCVVCGNGIQEAGENCDDGNTVDGDGCPANCMGTRFTCRLTSTAIGGTNPLISLRTIAIDELGGASNGSSQNVLEFRNMCNGRGEVREAYCRKQGGYYNSLSEISDPYHSDLVETEELPCDRLGLGYSCDMFGRCVPPESVLNPSPCDSTVIRIPQGNVNDHIVTGPPLAQTMPILTSNDLPILLRNGHISSPQGGISSPTTQFLHFVDNTTAFFDLAEDDRDIVDKFFHLRDGMPFAEYKLFFNNIRSVDDDFFRDFQGLELEMLGKRYVVLSAERFRSRGIYLTLLANWQRVTIPSTGTTSVHTTIGPITANSTFVDITLDNATNGMTDLIIDGVQIVSGAGPIRNGFIIGAGDSFVAFDRIGPQTTDLIITNDYLQLFDDDITDPTPPTHGFSLSGGNTRGSTSSSSNAGVIEDAAVTITGFFSGTDVFLNGISVLMDADGGAYDVYLQEGELLSHNLDEPASIFTENWDMRLRDYDTTDAYIEVGHFCPQNRGCRDFDGGAVYNISSRVTVGPFTYVDTCANETYNHLFSVDDPALLLEATCLPDAGARYVNRICPDGCSNGACI